jgi:hypothetical protein
MYRDSLLHLISTGSDEYVRDCYYSFYSKMRLSFICDKGRLSRNAVKILSRTYQSKIIVCGDFQIDETLLGLLIKTPFLNHNSRLDTDESEDAFVNLTQTEDAVTIIRKIDNTRGYTIFVKGAIPKQKGYHEYELFDDGIRWDLREIRGPVQAPRPTMLAQRYQGDKNFTNLLWIKEYGLVVNADGETRIVLGKAGDCESPMLPLTKEDIDMIRPEHKLCLLFQ